MFLFPTRLGRQYSSPFQTLASQINDLKHAESLDFYISMAGEDTGLGTDPQRSSPPSASIYRLEQDFWAFAHDRTGNATNVEWTAEIYYDGKSRESVNFNVDHLKPTGSVTNATPDNTVAPTSLFQPEDQFTIDQEEFDPGYNTVVLTAVFKLVEVTTSPEIIITVTDLGSAQMSFLLYKKFNADLAVVAVSPSAAVHSDRATVAPEAGMVREDVPAVPGPDQDTASAYVEAVELEPIIRG